MTAIYIMCAALIDDRELAGSGSKTGTHVSTTTQTPGRLTSHEVARLPLPLTEALDGDLAIVSSFRRRPESSWVPEGT
jgi:hypothetical protein